VKAKEIKEMSTSAIEAEIADLKTELFQLRFDLATGQIVNNSRIREVRKTIARMKTIIHERENPNPEKKLSKKARNEKTLKEQKRTNFMNVQKNKEA